MQEKGGRIRFTAFLLQGFEQATMVGWHVAAQVRASFIVLFQIDFAKLVELSH